MKKILLFFPILMLFGVSCSTESAISWNNKLIDGYNITVDEIENLEELISLETMGDSIVNQHILVAGNAALLQIERSLKHLNEQEVPSGAKECQARAIDMFESMKAQVDMGLRFVDYAASTSETEIDTYADTYDELSSISVLMVNAFVASHSAFEKDLDLPAK